MCRCVGLVDGCLLIAYLLGRFPMTEDIKDESASTTDDYAEVAKILEISESQPATQEPAPESELTEQIEEPTNTAEEKSEKPEISPEVQKSIDKRIAKEVSKRKALEEQLAVQEQKVQMLEGKVKDTPQEVSVPTDLRQMSADQLQEEDRKGENTWCGHPKDHCKTDTKLLMRMVNLNIIHQRKYKKHIIIIISVYY